MDSWRLSWLLTVLFLLILGCFVIYGARVIFKTDDLFIKRASACVFLAILLIFSVMVGFRFLIGFFVFHQ